MSHLDCENAQTTLSSIGKIYGVDTRAVTKFFDRFDIDEYFAKNSPDGDGAQETKRLLEISLGQPKPEITRTYWFHLTRVPPGTQFEDGIFPLGKALPRVWEALHDIFEDTRHSQRLKAMELGGVPDFQYNLKTKDPFHWGPYAMLVKEIGSFAHEVGNHDYLKTPEIVEDICNGYKSKYDEDIQPQVEAALVPTVVKFFSDDPDKQYGLEAAIYYAYLTHRGLELSHLANTCFEGEGLQIPPAQILYVEQGGLRAYKAN